MFKSIETKMLVKKRVEQTFLTFSRSDQRAENKTLIDDNYPGTFIIDVVAEIFLSKSETISEY